MPSSSTSPARFRLPGPRLALGLLRLSTEARPSEEVAISVIHTALDAGIRLLDTADSYGLSDADFHYGEVLARKALSTWSGPREEVLVATKAGFSRPKGKWVPNGRPEHLRKSIEGSLRAFGVERLPLFLLHGNDPKFPFEETLAALGEWQRAGLLQHIGLCNVSVPEIWQAERHFSVAVVQNELSVMDRSWAKEAVLELTRRLGIPFLAHRPLGGHAKTANLLKNRAMKPLAAALHCTPHQAALAALLDLDPGIVPLIGATRCESVLSSLKALDLRLSAADRAALHERISFEPAPDALALTEPPEPPPGLRPLAPNEEPGDLPEVVIVLGVQGAGKSAQVARYTDRGYARLNRDLLGGSLDDLVPRLHEMLGAGQNRVVLDNTYPTRVSRFPVIRAAHAHGVPVRCRHLDTPIAEAFENVVRRVLERYGRLLGPEELKELSKTDPNLPPPAALSRWAACFERPQLDEGFGAVEVVPFVRRPGPPRHGKGLLLDVDGTIRQTVSGEIYPRDPADVALLPGRREVLQRWLDDGYQLFFVSNQSGVASGNVTAEAVEACFARTVELLGLPVTEIAYCPHPAFPAGCFCRKPLPGMGIFLSDRHGLAREHLVMVGDMASDQQFAESLGARFVHTNDFFGG
ncbi:MAG: HAD-IIIA family hydrolase [Verrucomicrobia bacterium]|nr:HAD-IIIA family hydrolase [Verrucomicrobiota bacterium]